MRAGRAVAADMALLAPTAVVAVLGTILVASGQVPGSKPCKPCTKILMPVCGVDGDGEHKTFSNPCMLEWCNCMLEGANSDREFTVKVNKKCMGYTTNATKVPECFPEEAEEEEGGEGEEEETELITEGSETTVSSKGENQGSRTLHNTTTDNQTGSASPLGMVNFYMVLSLTVTVMLMTQLI